MSKFNLILFLAVLTAGCSGPYMEEPPWPAPTPLAKVERRTAAPVQTASLWTEDAPLTRAYQDKRAKEIGDLVTVVVVESSEASREASTDVSRDSQVNAGISGLLGMSDHMGLGADLYESAKFKPSIGATTNNLFKGSGSTSQKDVLRTRVAARIVNILDDGNLVLEGRRQVRVHEDTQFLFVRGIARPEDISNSNTVASASLADAQIIYTGKGLVSDQQRPGWMYRVVDKVWPF